MNVLSIDFDIIMAPVIEYYNNMVPIKQWEQIMEENPGMIIPKADLHHFNFLIQLLELKINKDIPIYVAFSHAKIVDFLKEDKNLTIFNIDHHHDLGYEIKDSTKEGTLSNLNCGNWAKYLFDNNQLENYVWVKNINSHEIHIPEIEECLKDAHYGNINLMDSETKEKLLELTFDKIFLCLSPEWIPPYYHTLFYGILDWINQKINIHLEIHEGQK